MKNTLVRNCCAGVAILTLSSALYATEYYNMKVCVTNGGTISSFPLTRYMDSTNAYNSAAGCSVYTYQTSSPTNIPRLLSIVLPTSPSIIVKNSSQVYPAICPYPGQVAATFAAITTLSNGDRLWVASKTLKLNYSTVQRSVCQSNGKPPCTIQTVGTCSSSWQ